MYIPPFQLGIFVGAVGVIALEITAVLIDNYRSKREEKHERNKNAPCGTGTTTQGECNH